MQRKLLATTGKRLQVLREDLGINQKELAHELGKMGISVDRSHIANIENNNRNPSLDLLTALAKALGTTTDYLLLLTDDPSPPNEQEPAAIPKGLSLPDEFQSLLAIYEQLSADEQKNLLNVIKSLRQVYVPRIIE
jgi:transcriptional regulator with XRE-family HTH domain